MRATVIFLILFGLCLNTSGGKADADSDPITASDKSFYEQIKKAVLTEDVEWFSEAVSYPVKIDAGKGMLRIKSKKDLKKYAPLIFTQHLKRVVRNQPADSLFKNWRGVMIGRGEIWFSEIGEKTKKEGEPVWVQRIIAINQIPDTDAPKK